MAKPSAKKQALDTIQRMPARASWDDIIYEMYVRQKLELGIAAADEGRAVPHDEVKRRFIRSR